MEGITDAYDHEKHPLFSFQMLNNSLLCNFLLYNLLYIIKLFTFAAQTGNATRCPTLLQKGRRGESEQKNNQEPSKQKKQWKKTAI